MWIVPCLVPGVPVFEKIGDFFRSKNIPIIGEIELGYLVEKGSVMAITGTNGKHDYDDVGWRDHESF